MALEGTVVESPLHRLATHAWKAIAVVGATSIAIGLATLLWPGVSTLVLGVLFGIFLLISGLFGLAVGMIAPMPGFVRAGALITSGLSVVLGLLCFRSGFHSVALLGLWVGIGWVMSSVTMLAHGLSSQDSNRGWNLVSGAVGLVAGITLIASPIRSTVALVWIAGIFLLVTGIAEVVRALQLRRRARYL